MNKTKLTFLLLLVLFFGCVSQQASNPSTQNQQLIAERSYATQTPNAQPSAPNASLKSDSVSFPPRESAIPADAIKMTPALDLNPPKSHSNEYSDPIPLPAQINTAGAEDSAFMMPDGNTLYVWFTPDVRVPVNKQLFDNVTGIYVSHKNSAAGGEQTWSNPERIFLTEPGKLALDGCEFVQGNKMLFCSAREGYTGMNWFSAEFKDGKWQNIKPETFNPAYKVGELHITADGNELYFHSDRPGGKGDYDVWVSKKVNGVWQEPQNIDTLSAKPGTLNTERMDGWPFVTEDGNELWIHRDYGLWRSKKANGTWQTPELMFSPLAGEASLDREGNVYFTHHFFKNDTMIEADIYMAKRKNQTN